MQAAVVMEPVQGYSGSVVYREEVLPRVQEICRKYDMLLVVDEILSGMGRTGKNFCVEHYGVVPDIIVFGKGTAGGFPLSGFAIREEFDWALEKMSASTTYGGNPMACAAGYASLKVLKEENILDNVNRVGRTMMNKLEEMKSTHPLVGDVRGKGLLLAIDLVQNRETREPHIDAGKLVYEEAFKRGVAWIPAGNILRLAPPLIIDENLALKALDIIEEAVAIAEKKYM